MAMSPLRLSQPRPLRRVLIVANANSRNGSCDLGPAASRLSEQGVACTVVATTTPDQLESEVRAHAPSVDAIVVAGGDGTINSALAPVLASGLPLGVLPLGTANDLARTLGIPTDLDAACDIIAGRQVTMIDLGWVNGRLFLNVASMGLSVAVTHALEPELKRRWGALGYGLTALRTIRAAHGFKVDVTCDGHTTTLTSIQVAVGNGRHYGGGMTVAHDAAIDDGRLDLYSLAPMGMWKLVSLVPAMRRGNHGRWDDVETLRGKRIELRTDRVLPINTDGEITTRTPAHFRVLPGVLPVLVPGGEEA